MKKMLLPALIAILFISPKLSIAQAPNLGGAANFVLFTTVGAVTNTGTSQLTGNVGTNSGSSTGFGNVNGVMHDGDSASGRAAADLLLAYDLLDDAIPAFFPAALLGDGDTLEAGVYSIAAVTTLSGDLYLDAEGDSSAVFIFQIEAAFSTNASSKVKLLNGAQACNVFWKVEGLVSMGSKTFMRGTIVAHNAAIDMNVNDTLEGRALSIAGAVTLNGILGYLPSGCGSPLLTGPAAPNLGSAACYAVFSGNGEITNGGDTYVTGDIGTNVGLTTGYNPLFVTGRIHPIPDGSTAAAAADLVNAYSYLNTLPEDIELLYPAQFGNNLVLTPHVYLMNAATAFTDSLYLNAQGNADAVFVIKINGALTTSVKAKVILINGAQAKNIYWKVEGALTLADSSVFHGTIICNNGAMAVNTGDSIYGRVLTTDGALSTAASVITSPDGSASCLVLPVTWLYFRGKAVQKNVLLEWGTATELNNGYFTIEKSRDGVTFETLTRVNAGAGNGNGVRNYSFTDLQPYTLNYYRISQTDQDGSKKYFNTIQVKMNAGGGFKVNQYVQQNYIYVETIGAAPGDGFIELFSMDGKKISSQKIVLTKETSLYKLEKPSNKGIYLINIGSNGRSVYNGKVVVF